MKTNTEKVAEAMNYGSPLNQIVIMTAISKYCEQIAEIKEEPEHWRNNLVSWEAWQAAAIDVARRIESE